MQSKSMQRKKDKKCNLKGKMFASVKKPSRAANEIEAKERERTEEN